MPLNVVPISARTAPFDARITANGSYTLPSYAFVPHASLYAIGSGFVPAPTLPGQSANFIAPPQMQRPYPLPDLQAVYGIRATIVKSS